MLHQFGNNSTSFSIFFPVSGKQAMEEGSYSSYYYTNPSSSSSSSVDCTLSLGPPSSSSSAPPPSFCWDVIAQSKPAAQPPHALRLPNAADPLLARRCANCDTTSTPLWRNGPRGPKSLCNACGIRYKKEERRAAATTATPPTANEASVAYGYNQRQQHHHHHHHQQQHSSWGCYNPSGAAAAAAGGNVRDDDMDQVPYLSWRLNVVPAAATTLFQYQ